MGRHLLSAFASHDPERFAQLLGASNDPVESIAILADIPDGLEGDVVARLTPEAAGRLLNELPDPVVTGWLSSCSVDTARRMLAHIGRERAAGLISGIEDRSKRRGLRRLVEYPPGTIGELVQFSVIAIRDSAPVASIQSEIQQQAGPPEAPVVLIRGDGTVSGVLDLIMFLQNHDQDSRAGDFRIPVKPVFADASQSSLRNRDEWSRLTSLPVVDYEGQLIGYVSRSGLESSLGAVDESSIFLQSGVELSKQFLEFMAQVLQMIFDRRNPR